MSKVEPFEVRGTRHTLRAAVWGEEGAERCDFDEFWDTLPETRQDAMLVRFRRFADTGTLPTPQQLNWLDYKLFEFKLREGPRVIAYHAGHRTKGLVVLTHGFLKKSPKTPSGQIDRAIEIRKLMKDAK